MGKQGYNDSKTPGQKPPVIIRGYEDQGVKTPAPAAARFNEGAQHRAQIEHATEARRQHSRQLSDPARKGFEKQSRFS